MAAMHRYRTLSGAYFSCLFPFYSTYLFSPSWLLPVKARPTDSCTALRTGRRWFAPVLRALYQGRGDRQSIILAAALQSARSFGSHESSRVMETCTYVAEVYLNL